MKIAGFEQSLRKKYFGGRLWAHNSGTEWTLSYQCLKFVRRQTNVEYEGPRRLLHEVFRNDDPQSFNVLKWRMWRVSCRSSLLFFASPIPNRNNVAVRVVMSIHPYSWQAKWPAKNVLALVLFCRIVQWSPSLPRSQHLPVENIRVHQARHLRTAGTEMALLTSCL